MNSILDITIDFDYSFYPNFNLEITKLLTSVVEKNTFIAYETKLTNGDDLLKITTDYFSLKTNSNKMIINIFLIIH